MTQAKSIFVWEGEEFVITWIDDRTLKNMSPITQVYGVCFNENGDILICRKNGKGKWQIPGGSPKGQETIEETLVRELKEEVDVKVKNIQIIGAQQIHSSNKKTSDVYQVRCICDLVELLELTPDPDDGEVWERKFVPAEKVTKYVNWGESGDAMFRDAINLHSGSNLYENQT